jgi:hypothetical protein
VQIFQPSVSTSSCVDPGRAAETRRILLDEAAATGRLVVPTHFRGGARPAAAAPHKQRPRLNIACGTVSGAADRSSVDTFPYSGVIAVTSVSTIISGKASAATPIRVWTGKGAAPKFLARHWP